MNRILTVKHPLLWLLTGAILTSLVLVIPQLGILQWFTMIPLFLGACALCEQESCSKRRAYAYGFLTVYVYYVVIFHWLARLYPLDFIGMDKTSALLVVLAGCLGLPILQAVVGGFILLFFRILYKTPLFARAPLCKPFAFAALWVIFEWTSTLTFAGVPWGRLCLGQIKLLPMLQSASLLGSYFVSFLLLAVNGLLAMALLSRPRSVLCASLAAILLVSNLCYGALALAVREKETPDTLRVAVIQGNVNSQQQWESDYDQKTREVYERLTRQAAEDGAELIVWPESAVSGILTERSSMGRFVRALATECNVTLIVNAIHTVDGEDYNALFLVDRDGQIHEDFYAKRHLVPFGEYVPMRELIMTLIPPLAELSALGNDLTAGEDSALFDTEWGSIGSLICFDSIYESLTLDSVRDGAELIVMSSNDSWFYDSAAIYQHQAQAQLRAIESGRDIVRAANTGISSVITRRGETDAWIDPLTEGYAVAEVQLRDGRTLYSILGNLFIYLCMIFVLILLVTGAVLTAKSGGTRRLGGAPIYVMSKKA